MKKIEVLNAGRHEVYQFFDLDDQLFMIKNIDGESITIMKSAAKNIAKILVEKIAENNSDNESDEYKSRF